MSIEHIELFPPQVRGERQVALHPSGRTFEYSPDILACASLFPSLFQQMRGERIRSLEIFAPLIERLADIYQIARPTLGVLQPEDRKFGRGNYNQLLNEILLHPKLSPVLLIQTLVHECHHAFQASFAASAVLRDVEDGVRPEEALKLFAPTIVDAVRARGQHEEPARVALGRIVLDSNERVSAARQYGAITQDVDEYLEMQKIYRNSFEELCSTVAELQVAVWQAEQELITAETLSRTWKNQLHELGWLGVGVSTLLMSLVDRRCRILRAHIGLLSQGVLHKCERIHTCMVKAGFMEG